MCFPGGALQIFRIAFKIRVQARFWRSVFCQENRKNADLPGALLRQKSLLQQLLCALFLSTKCVAKIARRQAPVLLC